ncbi:ribosome small subunit-dependent GTPase A [Flammeovirga pacifica]|uniref:Small ribosomal subunit biogenesis GTPase RsgA n=1 Tax=Flammeovirga pacifica TaxID=915059 RepID=A0A1S1Z419_FLAPC|nr:ribosome small subunit-dependent GTPase A [Flammeovirga pacifica]OHX67972.1 ribosome small subunit-dependent GTPase A [Flammeovirga pacifica]
MAKKGKKKKLVKEVIGDLKVGIITKSTGLWYEVEDKETRQFFKGRLRGKLKLKGMKVTNPIAVGDFVNYSLEDEVENTVIIHDILERKNIILRQSTRKKWHGHIIASNIDQAILIATLALPKTSLGFIDRFLVAAESYGVPTYIIFNKDDLLEDEDREYLDHLKSIYEPLGYKCLRVSAIENQNLNPLKSIISDKTSLLVGHSGVGKSTLLNKLASKMYQRTDEVSLYAMKGKHTTTFAEMFTLNEHNGHLIDTPGIKELGIMGIEENEIGHFFPEIREVMNDCKYNNCTHVHEPQCAVRELVDSGIIATSRYLSYLSMIEGDDNRK